MEPLAITIDDKRYIPLTFSGPAPMPSCACEQKLPEDKKLEHKHSSKDLQLKEDEHKSKIEECRSKGGIHNQLNATCSSALHSIGKGIDSIAASASNYLHTQSDDASFARLRKHFPNLCDEKLLGDYNCKLCTCNGVLGGNLIFTTNNLLFILEDECATNICIPLCEILCIQLVNPAECEGLAPPHFNAVLNPALDAKGLQVFSTANQLFIFKEFLSIAHTNSTLVHDCHMVLDNIWRSAAAVPNPKFQFVEASHFVQPPCTVSAPIKLLKQFDYATPTSRERRSGDVSRAPKFQCATESAGCSSRH